MNEFINGFIVGVFITAMAVFFTVIITHKKPQVKINESKTTLNFTINDNDYKIHRLSDSSWIVIKKY